jgi:ATP-dependent RNA helicase RhlE
MFKPSRRDREASEKRRLLRALLEAEGEKCTNAIIFCNRKTEVDILAKSLKKYGFDAAPIHGDLDQSQRTRTLDGFRDGKLRLLIASDVAARGLDVPSVSHVFNYDVPGHAEDYVHRIGRTGRAGRDGKAITLCGPRDDKALDAVEALVQRQIPRLDNPLQQDVAADRTTEAAAEEKPAAKTSSRSSGSRRKSGRSKPAETPTPVETPAPAPVAAEPTPAPKPERTPERAPSQRRESGNRTVGLGDHLPSFIALSFEERCAN